MLSWKSALMVVVLIHLIWTRRSTRAAEEQGGSVRRERVWEAGNEDGVVVGPCYTGLELVALWIEGSITMSVARESNFSVISVSSKASMGNFR